MKVLIVDDEALARVTLRALLQEFCEGISQIREAEDVPQAVSLIRAYQPDIVFLDIEMPGISGLKLLNYLNEDERKFKIIFVTAYSKYAVDAFRLSAIDYLLKPVNVTDLQMSIEKVKESYHFSQKKMDVLSENLDNDEIKKIVVPSSNGYEFIEVEDIRYLAAEGAYTYIQLFSGDTLLVSKSIKEFQKLEEYNLFYRCHRSYIINREAIKRLNNTDGLFIELDNDIQIPLSKRRKSDFMKWIKNTTTLEL